MKSVRITGITSKSSGGKLTIYLGNGTVHQFTSRKQANLFVSLTNKFLTRRLYDLRGIYSEISHSYARHWGYFEHNKPSMNAALRSDDRQCSMHLRGAEDSFNLCIERSSWPNGNHFAFTHLNRSIYNLKQVLLTLNRMQTKKSATHQLYEFDSLFERILSLEQSIITYGQSKAAFLVKAPLHLNETETAKTFLPEIPELKIVS